MTAFAIIFVVFGALGTIGTYLQFQTWYGLLDNLDRQARAMPLPLRWFAPGRHWPKRFDPIARIVSLIVGEAICVAFVVYGLVILVG